MLRFINIKQSDMFFIRSPKADKTISFGELRPLEIQIHWLGGSIVQNQSNVTKIAGSQNQCKTNLDFNVKSINF